MHRSLAIKNIYFTKIIELLEANTEQADISSKDIYEILKKMPISNKTSFSKRKMSSYMRELHICKRIKLTKQLRNNNFWVLI